MHIQTVSMFTARLLTRENNFTSVLISLLSNTEGITYSYWLVFLCILLSLSL
jgi:hypothetical protein